MGARWGVYGRVLEFFVRRKLLPHALAQRINTRRCAGFQSCGAQGLTPCVKLACLLPLQTVVRSTLSLTFVIAAARVVFNIKGR